jgi:DHA1 family bicyclomycin/chloramphenicol resistance-like MFS transporter
VALAGGLGLASVLPSLFVVVSSLGFVLPNATTLALAGHPRTAGSASALLGVLQFAVGARRQRRSRAWPAPPPLFPWPS